MSNCSVLGDGSSKTDFDHIKQSKPINLKRDELADEENLIAPDVSNACQSSTSKSRRSGIVH
jgi:hypothetical protein